MIVESLLHAPGDYDAAYALSLKIELEEQDL